MPKLVDYRNPPASEIRSMTMFLLAFGLRDGHAALPSYGLSHGKRSGLKPCDPIPPTPAPSKFDVRVSTRGGKRIDPTKARS